MEGFQKHILPLYIPEGNAIANSRSRPTSGLGAQSLIFVDKARDTLLL